VTHIPYNETQYNVGNSIFPGFNDKECLMLCGYEWGYSAHDQYLEEHHKDEIAEKQAGINTFYEKSKIFSSPYDLRIIKWFNIFGHPLGRDNGRSVFDKCLLQTNWCDDQGTHVSDYEKFLSNESRENFLSIVKKFRPKVLLFMGAKQIHYLQDQEVKRPFSEIFGAEIQRPCIQQKPYNGRRFKITFQAFEHITIISFPHPSGTRGLSDDYIKLFSEELKAILSDYRERKGV